MRGANRGKGTRGGRVNLGGLGDLPGLARPDPWPLLLLIFLGYLLLGVAFTWPLALHFTTGVIQKGGLPVDAGQGVWNLWWARSALLAGENPFVTRHLFYPLEQNLFYQTLSLPNALLVAPVLLAVGPIAAFNSVTLLSFGLGGLFTYRLARAVVASRPAALVAGFAFACSPYHIQRVWSGPMELIAIQWLPLFVLLLMGALARPGPLRIFAASLALLLTTLASQYYGLYAAVYAVAHVGLAALLAPTGARLRTLLGGAAVGLLWAVMLLPMLLLAGGLGGVALEDWYERQVYHSVALVDLVAPNIQHPLWGAAVAAWQGRLHPFGLENGAAPGLALTALAALALIRCRRSAWPWLALALLSLLLAMGPQLRLTEALSPVPGPFLLLDLVGPFRNSSRPAIFLALTSLALAVLAAIGVDGLLGERGAGGRGDKGTGGQGDGGTGGFRVFRAPSAFYLLSFALIIESLAAPWPITTLRADARAALLRADPAPGAVLELPPRNNDSQYLLNQICHGRPLVGGYLARLPSFPQTQYPSALQQLWDRERPAVAMPAFDLPAELAALGIRYVSLDLTQLPRFEAARLRDQLAAPGVSLAHADADVEVYIIKSSAAAPALTLGPGWYDPEASGDRRWRWMRGQAELNLLAPAQAVVTLSLRATAFGAPGALTIRQGGATIGSFEIPTAPRDRPLTLRLLLAPGANTLTLSGPETLSPEGRPLAFSIEALQIAVAPLALPSPARALAPPATISPLLAPPCS